MTTILHLLGFIFQRVTILKGRGKMNTKRELTKLCKLQLTIEEEISGQMNVSLY